MASSQNNPYNTNKWSSWISDSLGGLVTNTKELGSKIGEKTSGLSSKIGEKSSGLGSFLDDPEFSLENMKRKIESTVDEVVDYFDEDAEIAKQKQKEQQQQQRKSSSRDVSSSDRDEAKKKSHPSDNTLFPNRALIDSDDSDEEKLKRKASRHIDSDDDEDNDEEDDDEEHQAEDDELVNAPVWAAVLGITQDGGVPQPGCRRRCCINRKRKKIHASCLALVEQFTNKRWLFDCTPDFPEQLRALDTFTKKKKTTSKVDIGSGVGFGGNDNFAIDSLTLNANGDSGPNIKGIFLTHGHYGHYAGLLNFGKEVMDSRDVKVYCMPQLLDFLTCNAPWEQLVRNKNIVLECLEDGIPVQLGDGLFVTPFLVPHRADYTETVGFKIKGPAGYSALYIPDIDSWVKWEARLETFIKEVQIAFIDGTFYSMDELKGIRDISQVPHPPISQTMTLLRALPDIEKSKVHFIHLNHTNPVLRRSTPEHLNVLKEGFCVASELMRFPL